MGSTAELLSGSCRIAAMMSSTEIRLNSWNEASAWHGTKVSGDASLVDERVGKELVNGLHIDGKARRHATTPKKLVH